MDKIKSLTLSAEQGDAKSLNELAYYYLHGIGVEKSMKKAV